MHHKVCISGPITAQGFILLEFPDESFSIFLNFVRKSEEAQEWFTFNNSIIWVSLEGWGTQGNLLYPYILHPYQHGSIEYLE